jgi:hypothetical protein
MVEGLRGFVLLIAIVTCVAVGCSGRSQAVKTRGSASLDGFSVSGFVNLVRVPTGLAVVTGDRNGHPAIYAPTPGGTGQWVSAEGSPPLEETVAWVDGNVLRVVGHVCSTPAADSPTTNASQPKTMETLTRECPRDPIDALTFDLIDRSWSSATRTIEANGAWIDPVRGKGTLVFASRSTKLPATGMAVIDVTTGAMTAIPSAKSPPSPVACWIDGGFVVAAEGTWITKGPDGGVSGASGPDMGPVQPITFHRLSTDGVSDVEVRWTGLPAQILEMHTGGCSPDGLVMEVRTSQQAPPIGMIVGPGKDEGTLVAQRLPDPGFSGADISYGVDLTGATVIVTQRRIAATADGRTATVKAWDPATSAWHTVTERLPVGALVASNTDASFLQVAKTADRSEFHAIS